MFMTIFNNVTDQQGKVANPSFDKFFEMLEAEAKNTTPKKECRLWSPAVYVNGNRSKGSELEEKTNVIGLDIDGISKEEMETVFRFLAPFKYIAHTTATHGLKQVKANEKWRIILPLQHFVGEANYLKITNYINNSIGKVLDKQTLSVKRLFFFPTSENGKPRLYKSDGQLLSLSFVEKELIEDPDEFVTADVEYEVDAPVVEDTFDGDLTEDTVEAEVRPTVENIVEYISFYAKDAGDGERHEQLMRLTLILAKHNQKYTDNQVSQMFERLIKENNTNGGTDSIEEVIEKYTSAVKKIKQGELEAEQSKASVFVTPKGEETEEQKDKRRIEEAQQRYIQDLDRENRLSVPPRHIFTKQEAEELGIPHLFMVVQQGKSVLKEMCMSNEGQLYPVTIPKSSIKDNLETDYWIKRGYDIFQVKNEFKKDSKGKKKLVKVVRKMTSSTFFSVYVAKNANFETMTTLFHNKINVDGTRLYLPLKGRVSYEPKQHDEVKELIDLLGGKNKTRLRRWFELFADNSMNPKGRSTSGALSVLVLIGKSGVGKSSIIDFLSAYVNPSKRNTLDLMAGTFTDALEQQFVVGQDETQTALSSNKVQGFIRQLISANEHTLNKKFGGLTSIKGYLRIVLAGNDYGILPSNGIETDDARDGSVVRFLINPLDEEDQQKKLRVFWDKITEEGRYEELKQHFCEQLEWWKQNPQMLSPKEEQQKYGIKDLRFGVYSAPEKYTELVASGASGNISQQYFSDAVQSWLKNPELLSSISEGDSPDIAIMKNDEMFIRPTALETFLYQFKDKDDCDKKHITRATLKKVLNTFKVGGTKVIKSNNKSARYARIPKTSIYLLLKDTMDRDEITELLSTFSG